MFQPATARRTTILTCQRKPNRNGTSGPRSPPATDVASNRRQRPEPYHQRPRATNPTASSAKQYSFIMDLLKEARMTKTELNQHCVEAYGSVVDYITRHDASSLIDWLRNR